MQHKRIPNWKIDEVLPGLQEFTNYNQTIRGFRTSTDGTNSVYAVDHWVTRIAVIDIETRDILFLAHGIISATTSRLVGRILRSLPQHSVEKYLYALRASAPEDVRRLVRMSRI